MDEEEKMSNSREALYVCCSCNRRWNERGANLTAQICSECKYTVNPQFQDVNFQINYLIDSDSIFHMFSCSSKSRRQTEFEVHGMFVQNVITVGQIVV